MKDLIEAILANIRKFLPRFFAVVAAPRTNVPRLVKEPADPLQDGLVFLALTIAIAFILEAPRLGDDQDFVATAAPLLVINAIAVIAFNAALVMALKLVGGKGAFEPTLIASCYIIAPPFLFFIVFRTIMLGILAPHDPALTADFLDPVAHDQTLWDVFVEENFGSAFVFALMALALVLVPIIWFLICWRIYRELHQLSWVRSTLGYLLAVVLFYLIGSAGTLATRGLFGGAAIGTL